MPVTTAREDLLAAGLAVFDRDGFEGATVAAHPNPRAGSNGSFFHFFGSKKELAGTLFLEILGRYHASVLAAIGESCGAQEGVRQLIGHNLDWVVNNRREARYLFEISRRRMDRRGAGSAARAEFAPRGAVERWRAPLLERGELLPMTATLFFSQIIGPAQIFCRAWLSGRDRTDPRDQIDVLIPAPSVRWSCRMQATSREKKHDGNDRPRFRSDRNPHPRQCRAAGFYSPYRRGTIRIGRAAPARLK